MEPIKEELDESIFSAAEKAISNLFFENEGHHFSRNLPRKKLAYINTGKVRSLNDENNEQY